MHLERNEGVTAARAALETTLGVLEAEKLLTKLAAGDHVDVRAEYGHPTYALRAADRREARLKELADAEDGRAPRPPAL